MMIERRLEADLRQGLESFPVVAILGPRQVGKTTLALSLRNTWWRKTVYLDLERDSDRNKLADPELYLGSQSGKLVILDEVQRRPDLFRTLRSLVDERIRSGERAGHFLILGSASRDLLQQSSESLAGRIAYLQLSPLAYDELRVSPEYGSGSPLSANLMHRLWLRGGFPNSLLARSGPVSWQWRQNFIATYLERDLPQLGYRLPAERMRRLWSMLAHGQGAQLNLSRLSASLGVDGKTVRHNLDVLTDLYMVRQLPPWSGSSTKRLVKSPKVYLRDSGLLHRLANVPDLETLLGHPLCGSSWEGFVIETLLALMPSTWSASYYRTRARAEIDLVLEGPGSNCVAIEIKRSLSPRASVGFRSGADEVGANERYIVTPAGDSYTLGNGIDVYPLDRMVSRVAEL